MQLKFRFQGKVADIPVDPSTKLAELHAILAAHFVLEDSTIRLLAAGKTWNSQAESVGDALDPSKPVMVLATPNQKIDKLHSADAENDRQVQRRAKAAETLSLRAVKPVSTYKKPEYTFGNVKALPYGDQERALAYLERIRDDKAVQALMAKYRLRVGLLTELDPLTNTEVDHRKLGLNKNAGEVIYLRIRTDDYEGFCNYNEILLVLCHELAHNTHQDHSSQFWATCRQYEKDIKELNPWKGGHSLQ